MFLTLGPAAGSPQSQPVLADSTLGHRAAHGPVPQSFRPVPRPQGLRCERSGWSLRGSSSSSMFQGLPVSVFSTRELWTKRIRHVTVRSPSWRHKPPPSNLEKNLSPTPQNLGPPQDHPGYPEGRGRPCRGPGSLITEPRTDVGQELGIRVTCGARC